MRPNLSDKQLQAFQSFALSVANEAAAMVAENMGDVTARHKLDGSLVTEIDERSDRLIARRIATAYPDHNVLSEEQSTTFDPTYDFTWVVDPIDGTTNFARGLSIWGVSIGLLAGRYPVVGVLAFPLLREIFYAAQGLGAFHNDRRIRSTDIAIPESEQLIVTCTRTRKYHRLNSPLKVRILGSAAYDLAKVADGTALACIEATPKIWDLAAAAVILQEAGATLQTLAGAPLFPLDNALLDYQSLDMPVVAAGNDAIMAHVMGALSSKSE
jgi:myo-inositol-1(or 4)-monophosphatase